MVLDRIVSRWNGSLGHLWYGCTSSLFLHVGDETVIGREGTRGEPYIELLLLSGLGQVWTDTERNT